VTTIDESREGHGAGHHEQAAVPQIVDRDTWQAARDELLVREKAHTREGDAIAGRAGRRGSPGRRGHARRAGRDGRRRNASTRRCGAPLRADSDEDVLAALVVQRAAVEVAVERLEGEAGDVK
jgi:hypothetical protein